MLYSTSDIPEYPQTPSANVKNAYNITTVKGKYAGRNGGTEKTFPALLPGALEDYIGVKAGDVIKLQQAD